MMLPMTMPGASRLTMSQRTAPRLWWARTLEMDVKMMVAMEVAIAILTARSGPTPRADMMMVMNGTISMPPPMPSSPARKPVPMPSRASSRMSRGSSVMGGRGLRGRERKGVCKCHRTGILNRGSGGLGQPGVGFI
jgi:hypothetical protein